MHIALPGGKHSAQCGELGAGDFHLKGGLHGWLFPIVVITTLSIIRHAGVTSRGTGQDFNRT
jgi:mannitol-specific phosphotransferase system IIBC component